MYQAATQANAALVADRDVRLEKCVSRWRIKPRTGIKCPNIKFELEKGLAALEFNDPVR